MDGAVLMDVMSQVILAVSTDFIKMNRVIMNVVQNAYGKHVVWGLPYPKKPMDFPIDAMSMDVFGNKMSLMDGWNTSNNTLA